MRPPVAPRRSARPSPAAWIPRGPTTDWRRWRRQSETPDQPRSKASLRSTAFIPHREAAHRPDPPRWDSGTARPSHGKDRRSRPARRQGHPRPGLPYTPTEGMPGTRAVLAAIGVYTATSLPYRSKPGAGFHHGVEGFPSSTIWPPMSVRSPPNRRCRGHRPQWRHRDRPAGLPREGIRVPAPEVRVFAESGADTTNGHAFGAAQRQIRRAGEKGGQDFERAAAGASPLSESVVLHERAVHIQVGNLSPDGDQPVRIAIG